MPRLIARSWMGRTHHEIAYGDTPAKDCRLGQAVGAAIEITDREAELGIDALVRLTGLADRAGGQHGA